MFFTQLEKCVVDVNLKLKDAKLTEDDTKISIENARLDALRKVREYISHGDWTDRAKVREKVLYSLRYKNAAAAEKYETTINSIKVTKSNASKSIIGKIGSDILVRIMTASNLYELENIQSSFSSEVGLTGEQVLSLFPDFVSRSLPLEGDSSIGSDRLVNLCEMMSSYTNNNLMRAFVSLDRDALFVLKKVLSSNSVKNIKIQRALQEYFSGGEDIEKLRMVIDVNMVY